jgi:predicted trehalose synthase
MPNRVGSAVAQLHAKLKVLNSIRHDPAFGIATVMPHAALAPNVREDVPGRRRRIGADPVATGPRIVQTTERYLGTKQDLVHAPNDGIKLRVSI